VFSLPYEALVGGATGFTAEQFIQVNGFTNEFYGWGGEDDDLEKRSVDFPNILLQYLSFRYTCVCLFQFYNVYRMFNCLLLLTMLFLLLALLYGDVGYARRM
jgi:hypothetical protein